METQGYYDSPALQPIRPLLLDPQITEIMINGPSQVFVEKGGVMQDAGLQFQPEALSRLISAFLQPSGREVSSSTPYADFRLPDGSRGNVIIPPISLNGPVITIRKFTKHLQEAAHLVACGTLSNRMAQLLAAAVRCRANILFSGATGSGKTTTLGILSKYIPQGERIITIEDTAELQLQQKHVVSLECRRANLEGKGAVSLSDLVRNSLRMRPTRIIVGEIRGDEAADMIQAITSGHQGCLAVIHASSPMDAVSRLETMLLSRGLLLPIWAIQRQIVAAIDLIVQHEMLVDGTRKITHITELAGVENDRVILRDLFSYQRRGTQSDGKEFGQWTCGGTEPKFAEKCRKMGYTIPEKVYQAGYDV
ncbi:MAG: CpaF family protein [Planctomycetes bacterium]|nr:CpaF family protein [Planctomycetota bacterium]